MFGSVYSISEIALKPCKLWGYASRLLKDEVLSPFILSCGTPDMHKMAKYVSLLAICGLISLVTGCAYFKFPGVHKYDIQQGNIITQEMIDQLKPGMTRRQVRYVLGSPMVQDSFDNNRWDYYYRINKANGDIKEERLIIHFNGDTLSHFEGDFKPSPLEADRPSTEQTDQSEPEEDSLEAEANQRLEAESKLERGSN